MSKYPAAYRRPNHGFYSPGGGLSKPPRPAPTRRRDPRRRTPVPKRLPPPRPPSRPRIPAKYLGKVLAKRFLGPFGLFWDVYDLFQWAEGRDAYLGLEEAGYVKNCTLDTNRCAAQSTVLFQTQTYAAYTSTGLCFNQCLGFHTNPANTYPQAIPAINANSYVIIHDVHDFATDRSVSVETWEPVPGHGTPLVHPETAPVWLPVWPTTAPVLDPATLPIMKPVTVPKPPPIWPAPDVDPDADQDGDDGRVGSPPILPPAVVFPLSPTTPPVVVAPPTIGDTVVQPPTVVLEATGDDYTIITTPTPPKTPAPPTGPVVEGPKIHVRTVAGKAWAIINFATETLDFLDVLWKSLPESLRTGVRWIPESKKWYTPSIAEKLWDIYEHYDRIDPATAVINYANNQFEDWFYGQMGMTTGKASGEIGLSTGLDRAIRAGGNLEEIEGQDRSNLVPYLEYDKDTGLFQLIFEPLGVTFNLSGSAEA